MRAALVVRDSMNFVDDDRFDRFENFAAFSCSKQNVKRFRRGDENVRRSREHLAALVHERVARAHRGADFRHQQAAFGGELHDFAERDFEVFLDVVAERFQRRNVKNFKPVGEFAG